MGARTAPDVVAAADRVVTLVPSAKVR